MYLLIHDMDKLNYTIPYFIIIKIITTKNDYDTSNIVIINNITIIINIK